MSDTSIQDDTIEKNTGTEEAVSADTGKFLTFTSDGLIFAVRTDYVLEIITNHNIRSVPMLPECIQGIMNLRGMVLPVMDIRLRMNKPFVPYTSSTCIIVLDMDDVQIGLAVDSVLQVREIDMSLASMLPIDNKMKLVDHMIPLEDDSTVLFLDCEELIRL